MNLPLLFVRALLRCFTLALSAFFATGCAALMLTITLFLGGDVRWLRDDEAVVLAASGFAVATVWAVWLSAIYPLLAAFLITEMARARSFLIHVIGGGLVGIAAVIAGGGMNALVVALEGAYAPSQIWLSVLSAGFVGGFVHWVIAGHRAGKWLGEDRP